MAQFDFEPTSEQFAALYALFHHVYNVNFNQADRAFGFHARQCDSVGLPYWAQNNAATMAESKQVYYRNGELAIVRGACCLDWTASVKQ